MVHGALLYYGEILSTYALLGLVLLAARNLSAARARRWAIGLVVVACALWMVLGLLQGLGGEWVGTAHGEGQAKLAAFSAGALQTLQFHSWEVWATVPALWLLQGPSALAMFLFGYAAGRQQWLASPQAWDPRARRLLLITAPLGLLGALVYALTAAYKPGGGLETFAFGLGQLTAPLLTAAYCLLMLALFNTTAGARLCARLAPLGKMALSNYLMQSMLLGLLFTGYGAGWINQVEPWLLLPMAAAIFILQMWLSTHWLRRHPYGPFEWLLRAATLLAWPNWRRSQ